MENLLAEQLSLRRLGFSEHEIKENRLKQPHSIIYGHFHHAAYLFEQKGNSIHILSRGMNYLQDERRRSIHAETDAIEHLKPRWHKKKRKKINLMVIRTSKNGKLGSSQPCYHCMLQLMEQIPEMGYKLNYVCYSNQDESLTRIKFNKLVQVSNYHISGYYRKKHHILDELRS